MIVVPDAAPVQRYCPSCSAERDRERKRRSAKKAGKRILTPEQRASAKAKQKTDRDGLLARGASLSVEARRGPTWYADSEPCVHKLLRVAVPFDYSLSKNSLWSNTAKGHVFMRAEIKAARRAIALCIKSTAKRTGFKVFTGKVWIDLLVQKPDHRGDAVNVLDMVCDAAKDALGVDDRWFSVRRLDWEIVKVDPLIYIGISQEITEDHRVCSCCGGQWPLGMFKGERRECANCRSGKAYQMASEAA